MEHVADELRKIGERLAAYPDPFEHAGLFAAQQALCWAANPEAVASPYDIIVGNVAGPRGCSAQSRRPMFSDTSGHLTDGCE